MSSLVKAGWNYKTDSDEKKAVLLQNIKRNGLIQNLIVRELPTGFFEVVNGNHRFDALKDMGVESAHCYNVGKISELHAQRIAVETNETNFDTDQVKLGRIFTALNEEFSTEDLLTTMPYTETEFDMYKNLGSFDFDAYGSTSEGGDVDATTEGDGEEAGEEKWVDLTIHLPESVAKLWESQVYRVKEFIEKGQGGRKVRSNATVYELMAVILDGLSTDDFTSLTSGE